MNRIAATREGGKIVSAVLQEWSKQGHCWCDVRPLALDEQGNILLTVVMHQQESEDSTGKGYLLTCEESEQSDDTCL